MYPTPNPPVHSKKNGYDLISIHKLSVPLIFYVDFLSKLVKNSTIRHLLIGRIWTFFKGDEASSNYFCPSCGLYREDCTPNMAKIDILV